MGNSEKVLRVPLADGYCLVATPCEGDGYKEIYIDLHGPDGSFCQSLAIAGEESGIDENGEVRPISGQYFVKVYSDPNSEDFNQDFIFGRRLEAEEVSYDE